MSKLRLAVSVLLLVVIAAGLVGIGFAAGRGYPPFDTVLAATGLKIAPAQVQSTSSNGDLGKNFDVFWEAYRILSREYVEPSKLKDPQKLTYGAIKGLIDSLDDPYTAQFDPAHFQMETSDFKGSFDGIGANVTKQDNQVVIIAPLEGSPAEKAGIRPGDRIVRVDGEDISKLSLTDAVNKIRGPRGSTVKLTLLRQGETRPIEMEIVRGEIKTQSVYWKMLDNNIALFRITEFTETTATDMIKQLNDAKSQNAKGVILDLRRNPGGLLDVTVDVASQFLKDGVVTYSVDNAGKKVVYPVKKGGVALDIPLAVLVDKGSASGSEVLAGSLQDAGRAPLIGDETFGKGSVNQLHRLSDGSGLYVTVARWMTPKGRAIEGKGLSPDIDIKLSDDDIKNQDDKQLKRAIDYINNGS